jgi:hypothetical protein
MTKREINIVKETIARMRHELGERVAPGPQDSWRNNHTGDGVTQEDAVEIRKEVRKFVAKMDTV